jgi:hypothetical protein
MKTATSIAGFGEVDDLSGNFLGMTYFLIIRALVYMVSENWAFSLQVPFLRSLA